MKRIIIAVTATLLLLGMMPPAQAQELAPTVVSITFDDGYAATGTGLDVMKQRGLRGRWVRPVGARSIGDVAEGQRPSRHPSSAGHPTSPASASAAHRGLPDNAGDGADRDAGRHRSERAPHDQRAHHVHEHVRSQHHHERLRGRGGSRGRCCRGRAGQAGKHGDSRQWVRAVRARHVADMAADQCNGRDCPDSWLIVRLAGSKTDVVLRR